jgi:hypothetical protein
MSTNSIHAWIIDHDDKLLFVILYIGLAVALSIWLGLFWLVVVVAIHFIFEFIRQKFLRKNLFNVLLEVVWETKLDLALILFALVITLYMHIIVGAISIGLVARLSTVSRFSRLGTVFQSGLRAAPRIAGWERLMRSFLLSIDDLVQFVRAFGRRGKKRQDPDTMVIEELDVDKSVEFTQHDPENESPWGSWAKPWGKGDFGAVLIAVVCLILIFTAPLITEHTYASALEVLGQELHPFPGN